MSWYGILAGIKKKKFLLVSCFVILIFLLQGVSALSVQTFSEKHDIVDHEIVFRVINDGLADTLKSWDFNLINLDKRIPTNAKYEVQVVSSLPEYRYDVSKVFCDPKNIGTYDLNHSLEYYCYTDDQRKEILYSCQSDKECFQNKTNETFIGTKNVFSWVLLKTQNEMSKTADASKSTFVLDPYLFEKSKETFIRVSWKIPLVDGLGGSRGTWSMNPTNDWNSEWSYWKDINVAAPADQNSYKWSQLRINLDSSTLVSSGKLQSDCDDFRVVFVDTNSLDINVVGCNTTDTNIFFASPIRVSVGDSNANALKLFYGNASAVKYPNNRFSYQTLYDDFNNGDLSDWNAIGAWNEAANVPAGSDYKGWAYNTNGNGRSIVYLGRTFEIPSDSVTLSIRTGFQGLTGNNSSKTGFVDTAVAVGDPQNGLFSNYDFGTTYRHNWLISYLAGIQTSNATLATDDAAYLADRVDINGTNIVLGTKNNRDVNLDSDWTLVQFANSSWLNSQMTAFIGNTDKFGQSWDTVLVKYTHNTNAYLGLENVAGFNASLKGFDNADYNFKGNIKIDFNVLGLAAGSSNINDYNFALYYSTFKNTKGTRIVDANLNTASCSDTNAEKYPACYYVWDSSTIKDQNGVFLALDLNSGTNQLSVYSTQPFRIDNNAPTINLFGATNNDWNSVIITFSISTDDNGTGVLGTQYRLDSNAESGINYGSWTNYSVPITLSSNDGNYALDVNSWDYNRNYTNTHFYLLQDMNTPTISSSYPSTNLSGTNSTLTFIFYVNDFNGSAENSGLGNMKVRDGDTNAVLSDSNVVCSNKTCSLLVAFATGETKYVQCTVFDDFNRVSVDFNSGKFERTSGGVVVPPGGGGGSPSVILPNFVTPSLVTLQPSTATLSVPPGATRVYTVLIHNLTSQILPIETSLHDGLENYLVLQTPDSALGPGETRLLVWNVTVPVDENYSFFTGYVQFNLNDGQEYVKQELSLSPNPVFDLNTLFSLQLFGFPAVFVVVILFVLVVIVWQSFKR